MYRISVAASIQIYANYIPDSAHAGQNHELCLSTHEHLPRVTPVQHSKKLMPTAQAGGDIQYDSAESIV